MSNWKKSMMASAGGAADAFYMTSGDSLYNQGTAVDVDSNGNIWVVGVADDGAGTSNKVGLVNVIQPDGTVLYSKHYEVQTSSTRRNVLGAHVSCDGTDGYVQWRLGSYGFVVMKLNSSLTEQWSYRWERNSQDYLYGAAGSVTMCNDGTYLYCADGRIGSTFHGIIMKIRMSDGDTSNSNQKRDLISNAGNGGYFRPYTMHYDSARDQIIMVALATNGTGSAFNVGVLAFDPDVSIAPNWSIIVGNPTEYCYPQAGSIGISSSGKLYIPTLNRLSNADGSLQDPAILEINASTGSLDDVFTAQGYHAPAQAAVINADGKLAVMGRSNDSSLNAYATGGTNKIMTWVHDLSSRSSVPSPEIYFDYPNGITANAFYYNMMYDSTSESLIYVGAEENFGAGNRDMFMAKTSSVDLAPTGNYGDIGVASTSWSSVSTSQSYPSVLNSNNYLSNGNLAINRYTTTINVSNSGYTHTKVDF